MEILDCLTVGLEHDDITGHVADIDRAGRVDVVTDKPAAIDDQAQKFFLVGRMRRL